MSSIQEYSQLPVGAAPQPLSIPHFPDTLHAVIWRNWDVVDAAALAGVLKGTVEQITEIAQSMGLPPQRDIPADELSRNYMTFLRRNWQLLPYEQLCPLLGWTPAETLTALNEDDFMYYKLGRLKPAAPPVYYTQPDAAARARAAEIARIVKEDLGDAIHMPAEPPFGFIQRFGDSSCRPVAEAENAFQLRMVYPYFLRYGDPLLGNGIDDIPEGYLAELAASGINAIWLQGVLNMLAPWECAPELSVGWQERLENLNLLVERARKYGIEVLMYLNEPRAMPRSFFDEHPELMGIPEAYDPPNSPDLVTLCTSTPGVQEFLVNSVQHVFERVPGLGGLLVITYSENLTNCYSRDFENADLPVCPRCAEHGPEVVNAEVCALLERGMRQAGSDGKFVLYVWSTPEHWVPALIDNLPASTWVLCISEWGKTFTRGDYTGRINEYSISEVGPSEQSLRQWELARQRDLRIAAKMQAANSFEVSSLPYIPALRLVAEHLSNMREAGIGALMLGWSAGGSPSPNLELVGEFVRRPQITVPEALHAVAVKRFGEEAAGEVVRAWNLMSDAYLEFPFDIAVCYAGPQSLGPATPMFAEPTGYSATMVTFPYDDLKSWCGPYSAETFISQFHKVAEGWQLGVDVLDEIRKTHASESLDEEWRIAEAARTHFRSTVNLARFIVARDSQDTAAAIEALHDEIDLAKKLFAVTAGDSRIGYEASNHYAYNRLDLVEKILNCRDLLAGLESG